MENYPTRSSPKKGKKLDRRRDPFTLKCFQVRMRLLPSGLPRSTVYDIYVLATDYVIRYLILWHTLLYTLHVYTIIHTVLECVCVCVRVCVYTTCNSAESWDPPPLDIQLEERRVENFNQIFFNVELVLFYFIFFFYFSSFFLGNWNSHSLWSSSPFFLIFFHFKVEEEKNRLKSVWCFSSPCVASFMKVTLYAPTLLMDVFIQDGKGKEKQKEQPGSWATSAHFRPSTVERVNKSTSIFGSINLIGLLPATAKKKKIKK